MRKGYLEITNDGYGFLRWPAFNFTPHADDVYISPNFIRDHNLQNGNLIRVVARAPREREKFISVDEVTHVENLPVDQWVRPPAFEKLTALSPRERLVLEDPETAHGEPPGDRYHRTARQRAAGCDRRATTRVAKRYSSKRSRVPSPATIQRPRSSSYSSTNVRKR